MNEILTDPFENYDSKWIRNALLGILLQFC
jgi:hypothetical protein